MTKQEIIQLLNENPVMSLATLEGDQPRVREILIYRADEEGIIFHTASSKDLFKQLKQHSKVEACFQCKGTQIRVTGEVEQIEDDRLKAEIFAHPSRKFLQAWIELGVEQLFAMFRIKNCEAVCWTMETNFAPKEVIKLHD